MQVKPYDITTLADGVIDVEIDGPNTHPRIEAAKAAALAAAKACLGKDACTVYLAMMVYPEDTPQWDEAAARWQAATTAAEVAFWGELDTYPHYGGITIVVTNDKPRARPGNGG